MPGAPRQPARRTNVPNELAATLCSVAGCPSMSREGPILDQNGMQTRLAALLAHIGVDVQAAHEQGRLMLPSERVRTAHRIFRFRSFL